MNPARRHTLVLALASLALSACGEDDSGQGASAPDPSAPAPPPGPGPASGDGSVSASGTPIRITVGDTELTARLDDNATARDLAAQLPLTLTFRDHNSVEKTAPLRRELSLENAPEGHDPSAGDIGYWAPDGDLVFYYDDAAPFSTASSGSASSTARWTRSRPKAKTSARRLNPLRRQRDATDQELARDGSRS